VLFRSRCVVLLCCQAVACGGGLIAMLPSSCTWRWVDCYAAKQLHVAGGWLLCCQAVACGGVLICYAAKQLHVAVG
jgi:hypothetical protein